MKKHIAFIFPGQGSQAVGMLDSFAQNVLVQDTLKEASEALGQDLAQLIHQGPAEQLALTENTQPVMLIAAIAIYRAWIAAGGPVPKILAGHSLGEYSAYVVAKSLRFADAVPLVRFRAQAMQEAVPVGTGGMAAIVGLDDAAVIRLCLEAASVSGSVVEAVNFNAPSQVVIAGSKNGVETACAMAKPAGAKMAVPLAVSAPFHSSLLQPAALRLQEYLGGIELSSPQIEVINNVDVSILSGPSAIKEALTRQACAPVRWVQTIQLMVEQGVTHIVECGPGKVLAGMVKRIDSQVRILGISSPESITQVLGELQEN